MEEQLIKSEKSQIESKRNAWANMGEGVHNTEMKLQGMAQKALQLAENLPSCIEEVKDAESNLVLLKKEQKTIEAERKTITLRLDELSSRLMNSEKSLNEPIKKLSDAIIAVKKSHEEEVKKKQNALIEVTALREAIINRVNQLDFDFKTKIANQVSFALQWALDKGDIKPEAVEEYITQCSEKFKEVDFKCDINIPHLIYTKQEEVDALLVEHFKIIAKPYVALYKEELKLKFADYAVAYQNKAEALKIAAEQEKEKQALLESEKNNKDIATKIESVSSSNIEVVSDVKALKKSYEIDMEETVENAILIMAAFVANVDKCLPKLKVNKWFSFTPAQAGVALAKVKCDDNSFQPNGLKFKEVSKL